MQPFYQFLACQKGTPYASLFCYLFVCSSKKSNEASAVDKMVVKLWVSNLVTDKLVLQDLLLVRNCQNHSVAMSIRSSDTRAHTTMSAPYVKTPRVVVLWRRSVWALDELLRMFAGILEIRCCLIIMAAVMAFNPWIASRRNSLFVNTQQHSIFAQGISFVLLNKILYEITLKIGFKAPDIKCQAQARWFQW